MDSDLRQQIERKEISILQWATIISRRFKIPILHMSKSLQRLKALELKDCKIISQIIWNTLIFSLLQASLILEISLKKETRVVLNLTITKIPVTFKIYPIVQILLRKVCSMQLLMFLISIVITILLQRTLMAPFKSVLSLVLVKVTQLLKDLSQAIKIR